MQQYCVCHLKPLRRGAPTRLVIVLQHDLLDALRARVVAPLLSRIEDGSIASLMPEVGFAGETYRVGLPQMATVDVAALEEPLGRIDARYEIMRGIDLLFTGV